MAGDLAAWFQAAIDQAEQAGTWGGMGALAKSSGVARQALYDILKGRQVSQEKVRAIARAMGLSVPRTGAVVMQGGASAAVLASLAAARADLRSAEAQILAVERALTSADADADAARPRADLKAIAKAQREDVDRQRPRGARRAGGKG